jgi:hypothetical protein
MRTSPRTARILAACALAGLLPGCRSAEWEHGGITGDVRVEDRGEERSPRYMLRFPAIPLARENTYTFALRGVPFAKAHFGLVLADEAERAAIERLAPEVELTVAGAGGTLLRFDGTFTRAPAFAGPTRAEAEDAVRQRWTFGEIGDGVALFYPDDVGMLTLVPEQEYLFILRVETPRASPGGDPLRVTPTLVVVSAPGAG